MKPRQSTIFFVINSLAGGGAERMMTELVTAFAPYRDDFRLALVLLDEETSAYQPPEWITVHRLDSGFSLIRSFWKFFRLCRQVRPDVTLSFLSRANFVTVAVAKILGFRAVISERVNTSGHFRQGMAAAISRLLVRAFYPRADRVIAVSRGIEEDLATNFGVARSKIVTIANPVNSDRIRAAAADTVPNFIRPPYAIAISRLSNNKNAIMTVEALAASSQASLNLLILGQGSEREAILKRAAELGVTERVVMPGFVSNPYPYLAAAGCYLSGSNAEGFPNGLVEALALGVPAISTNCPSGPSEVLADARREDIAGLHEGPYGILVPQNDPDSMGQAIDRILSPDISQRYRQAGPRRARDYSLEQARDRYWSVLTDEIAGMHHEETA